MNDVAHREDYLTEKEAQSFRDLFLRNWTSYKEKPQEMTNAQWLQELFLRELPEMTAEEAAQESVDILESMDVFQENHRSLEEASKNGISKEEWLEGKFNEASVGYSTQQFGETLQILDDALYMENLKLAEGLTRAVDGQIKMSPNLDGNIAEHYHSATANLNAVLQGKDVKAEVRDVFTSNSVDVRLTDTVTGTYQNYQLKYGQDAKATIDLIERGNYNNQRIVVPTEQLDEVQAHFQAKGSQKTITDRIEGGKPLTKAQAKDMQLEAQQSGVAPKFDYNQFDYKNLTKRVVDDASTMALQSVAITTGMYLARKVVKNETIKGDELLETAIRTGADTGVKTVVAGTLKVAVEKGILKTIPKGNPAVLFANVACVAVENAKIAHKVATGKISATKGLDEMGKTSSSMVGGMLALKKGAELGKNAGTLVGVMMPALAPVTSVVGGFVGGTIAYMAGSKVGDNVFEGAKKIATVAKTVGKIAVDNLKNTAKTVGHVLTSPLKALSKLFH